MTKILFIIDNKFRDLWGIYDLINKSKKENIRIDLCNKFNWMLAIKSLSPNVVILPNAKDLGGRVFQSMVNYLYSKKIIIIVYPSEGLDYSKKSLKNEFPLKMAKKVTKYFLWAEKHGTYLRELGYKSKVTVIGTMKFHHHKILKKNSKKIKTIGVITTGRYTTSSFGDYEVNIPRIIHSRQHTKNTYFDSIKYLKNEIEFFDILSQIIKKNSKKFKFIIKPHPFENPQIYKDAYKEAEIYEDPNIGNFLSKVDVVLNQFSGGSYDAVLSNVPVINISNLILMNKRKYFSDQANYPPSLLGHKVKSIDEISKLLSRYNQETLFKKHYNRSERNIVQSTAPKLNTVDLFIEEIKKLKIKNVKNINYFIFVKYYLKDLYLQWFNKRNTLFFPFRKSDKELLKKFKIN
tara:strand:+ start:1367 stop:2581 length:1215 start_codon:yes stop_codon:yes gene_type:complete